MQVKLRKAKVYRMITNFEESGTLRRGDTVHRPIRSEFEVNQLGAQGSYTRQDVTDADETMVVEHKPEVTFYIQDPDVIQSNYKSANEYADDAGDKIGDYYDGKILGEYDQADSKVGNFEIAASGAAGDGIGFTLTTSNIVKFFGRCRKKLDDLDVSDEKRWGVISPGFYEVLWQFIAGKESLLGDNTGTNGNIGRYGGFNLFKNTNVGWSGRLEFGTNPTNTDTVVINGVTFTFLATLGTAAGNVHICSDAAKTLDQFVAAINTPGTTVAEDTDTGFVALSADNQKKMKNITATDGGTYLTLKATGRNYVSVSETLTAAADVWTATKQIQHNLFGQGTPTDMVIQKEMNLAIESRDGHLGKDFVTWSMAAIKTFDEGDKLLVNAQIRSDEF